MTRKLLLALILAFVAPAGADTFTATWTKIDQGEGWGNSGFMHSSGRVILMGGGINGEAEANKQVWVGTLN